MRDSSKPGRTGGRVRDSRLVQLTREARRPSRWWLAWVVVLVIVVAARPLGTSIGTLVLDDPAPTSLWFPYVGAFTSVAVLLALFLWVRVKERRPLATMGFRPRRDAVRLLLGFAVGGSLLSTAVLLGLATGVYADGQTAHTRLGIEALLPLVPLVLLGLLQGVAQEALTRGYLLQMSLRQLPVGVAVIGTSALVAVLHTLSPVAMLNAFLYATFAALVALQQGSLWLVAGIQAGWSVFSLDIFGLPVGGIPDPATLWSVGPTPDGGSALLSGGVFGPDAGLLATAVLAAATVVAIVRLRRAAPKAGTPASAQGSPELWAQPAQPPAHTPRKERIHVTPHR